MFEFNPINLWKRRKAVKELEIEARKYGMRGSLYNDMRELYKDEWDVLVESIVDGEKPSVVAEAIVYEFIIWIIKNAIGRDEKVKARMRETIRNPEHKDRMPIFQTIDSYLVAQTNDRVRLEPFRESENEEGRKLFNQTLDGLSAWIANEIFDGSETDQITVRNYLNSSSTEFWLDCFKASADWAKSDKGELARLKLNTVLSGELKAEEIEELFKEPK